MLETIADLATAFALAALTISMVLTTRRIDKLETRIRDLERKRDRV